MEQTLISRQDLAKRWGFESPNSLINYENDGLLTRNPNFKYPKYYMEEIIKIETLGEVNPLSPLERKRLNNRIELLEKENEELKKVINKVKQILYI
ncbi:transcription factor [Clostridium paraputrificum]|uniref:transcription factor n=1 Tax=Clostridium paraputrificum TaxID=29363 RepID=UPI00325AF45A